MIRRLKRMNHLLFFRVSVITDEQRILWDSHTKRLLGPKFSQEYVVEHPEVIEAFDKGIAFSTDYSDLLGQKFFYMAKTFDFHGKTYLIRTGFPHAYIQSVSEDFQFWIVALGSLVLAFFGGMTLLVVNRLTSPIQQIINILTPYKANQLDELANLDFSVTTKQQEFVRLGDTLSALSKGIKEHVDTITTERNEKESILESLEEGIVAVGRDGRVQYLNGRSTELMGVTSDVDSIEELPWKESIALLKRCQNENGVLQEVLQVKGPKGRIYLQMIAIPREGGMGAILVLQDQTQERRIAAMRKNFVANASHELKTPITIIQGFAETLHDNPQLPKDTTHEVTGKIVKNCERMTQLIRDLLALTDIEHLPETRLVDVELGDLLQQCQATVEAVYTDAEVTVQQGDWHVVGDPSLLEMAFTNLLNNGAKYSEAPARIEVGFERRGSEIGVSVRDHGHGIPEDQLDQIFQRFYRVESAYTKKTGGSGLGLAIVDTIVEKHLGRIEVESVLGEGTVFRVWLPVER